MSDNSLSKNSYSNEEQSRAKRDSERNAQESENKKEAYWMRCPKCGGQMEEKDMEKVKVDICTSCDGIFSTRASSKSFQNAMNHMPYLIK